MIKVQDKNDANKGTLKTLRGTKRLAIALVQEEMKMMKITQELEGGTFNI